MSGRVVSGQPHICGKHALSKFFIGEFCVLNLSFFLTNFVLILLTGIVLASPVRADTNELYECSLSAEQSEYLVTCDYPNAPISTVTIPNDLLATVEDIEADAHNYVSSYNFDNSVTAFDIGSSLIGLHLSSYEIQKEGSAQAAAGRDEFLVVELKSSGVRHGHINLGITKSRVRSEGCFAAVSHTFFLGDINNDGRQDIGAAREELKCDRYVNPEGMDGMRGPFYVASPIQWYLFSEGYWIESADHNGQMPTKYSELPLLAILMTPVEYVQQVLAPK